MAIGDTPSGPGRRGVGAPEGWETPIGMAKRRVTKLHQQGLKEMEAYGKLLDVVNEVSPLPPVEGTQTARPMRGGAVGRNRLNRLCDAYRKHVTPVKFSDAPETPLPEQLAMDFRPPIVDALCDGTDAVVSLEFINSLLSDIFSAILTRDSFGDELDAEVDSLTDAQHALDEVAVGIEEIGASRTDPWMMYDTLTTTLDQVVADRQAHLNKTAERTGRTGHQLCGIIYTPFDWTYPVLTAATRLRESLDRAWIARS